MLLNDFYTILDREQSGDSLKATILINAKHQIFNGHFPGQPIVPGVCMLQMVKELMEIQFEKKLFISEADNIKFLSVINPKENKEIQVTITYALQANTLITQAILFAGTTTFFKLKAVLKLLDDTAS